MIARIPTICIALAILAGCALPPPYEGGPLETYDEMTKYDLVDHHDGYEIHVFYEKDDPDDLVDDIADVVFAYFGAYGGDDEMGEFKRECRERIYSVAQQYADTLGQLEPYLQWERARRLNNDIYGTPYKGVRYGGSGGETRTCHAYAYFRWKAAASQ